MADLLDMTIPKDEQEEIKEFVATLLILPKEDRAVLLSNANVLRFVGILRRQGHRKEEIMPLEEMAVLEALELYALGFEINLNDGAISCIKAKEE